MKKSDLIFDNVDEFLKANPNLAITKPVPNTAAIRAILRAGGTLEGVKLVEAEKTPANPPAIGAEDEQDMGPDSAITDAEIPSSKQAPFHAGLKHKTATV